MPPDETVSIMDRRLQLYKDTETVAAIYLKNGIKLTGKVLQFDASTIELSCASPESILIDRTGISSLQKATQK